MRSHAQLFLSPLVLTVALGCGESAQSPTAPEPEPALTATASAPLPLRQLSTGTTHACGVTTDNRAYCWGLNWYGQLGDGSFGAAEITRPVAAASGRQFLE